MRALIAPLLLVPAFAFAQSVESGPRLSVVELFTSEGCSSCPPADAWLNKTLPQKDAVAIAYHVDYWNSLGWADPFSSAAYTERQRTMAERDGGHVYTPEVVLDGHEMTRDDLGAALKKRAAVAPVKVSLKVTREGSALHIEAKSSDPALRLRVVLVESGLRVVVPRGENAGRTLEHDHVARRVLEGNAGALRTTVDLPSEWKRAELGAIAYVQDDRTGDIRQAVALAHVD